MPDSSYAFYRFRGMFVGLVNKGNFVYVEVGTSQIKPSTSELTADFYGNAEKITKEQFVEEYAANITTYWRNILS